MNINDIWKLQLSDEKTNKDLKILKDQYTNLKKDIKDRFEDKVEKIQQGDDLVAECFKNGKSFYCCKKKFKTRR